MSKGLYTVLPILSENKKGWPWHGETQVTDYDNKKVWPKISIVTPSYNQGIFIEETLRSILLQNYPSLELIVIDGGSKDDSVDIIKKYSSWITYWVSEKDKGQSDALNKGFRKVTGEIVTWLNSDDLFTNGALKRVAEIFSGVSEDVGLIYGGTTLFNDKKIVKNAYGYNNPGIERFISGQAFSQPSGFFKKKYLDEAGAWVREDLHLGMDYDLFARLACVCRFQEVEEMFSLYRLHEASKTISQHANLVDDWTKTFSNLCRNLGWHDVLQKLSEVDFLQPFLNYSYELPFREKKEITGNTDRKKALFYHLCYWLKSFYWYNKHDEARKLISLLKKDYPAEWLSIEKDIPQIMFKLSLPPVVLGVLKRIKKNA